MNEQSAQAALDVLAKLGDTPEEIRQTLNEMGVKGVYGNKARRILTICPLARYLQEQVGLGWQVGSVVAFYSNEKGMAESIIHLPVACSRFVHNFDIGRYPELIESE